ncbi:unnamed protein product [Protopolystoma xenopodis]|uniref:Large ribosomal subunit protein bL12 C-terminal domain-containing protein n=1 Tax=Protopolystoma xenopodis TaxID=117903 RepID=A0A448WIA6_9PLAT|nr:unnamed protein product [Protopolystoma xenopodis]
MRIVAASRLLFLPKIRQLSIHHNISSSLKKEVSDLHSCTPSDKEDAKTYPPHISRLADSICDLSLLETTDLVELLRKRLNMQNPFTMMQPQPISPPSSDLPGILDPEDEPPATKTSFSVKLIKFDPSKKIQVIKEVKNINPDLNLVQAKKFVESLPDFLMKDISEEQAQQTKTALEAAGATVEIE